MRDRKSPQKRAQVSEQIRGAVGIDTDDAIRHRRYLRHTMRAASSAEQDIKGVSDKGDIGYAAFEIASAALVWLEGRLSTAVVTTPLALILETREPVMLPVYGPTGGMTCSQRAWVESDPPVPPSATSSVPSGPHFTPRGLFNLVQQTVRLCGRLVPH